MQFTSKIINWYFNKKSLPYWCILALDCAILLFFYYFGFYCVLGGDGVVEHFWTKTLILCACMPIYIIAFKVFHTYANVIRYSSFVDLLNVVKANFSGSLCMWILRLCFFDDDSEMLLLYPGLRVILFAFCFGTLAMCGWRVLVKIVYDVSDLNTDTRNAYIYGTHEGGVGLAKSIRSEKSAKFMLKGFVTPDDVHKHQYLMGVPVYKADDRLISRMKEQHVQALLVSPLLTEQFRNDDRLIGALTDADIKIYMIPKATEWNGEQTTVQSQMLHHVEIEDLLPRDEISIDLDQVAAALRGKRIMVTGSAGSIGSEMVRQISKFCPAEMILIDSAETPQHDIRLMMAKNYPDIKAETIVTTICSQSRMEHIFSTYRPEYVFHAAAYKHVPMMEDNPCESVQNNIYGTRILADLSVKYGVRKFVMISTDKAVNPTNVMGCSKRICEIYVQSLNNAIRDGHVDGVTQFVTTRFGNVLGSNGSVIPLFRKQIAAGGPITVTDPDIIRFFMLIPEACELVLEAGVKGHGGEIFVFDMGAPVKIADLARRMIKLSGAQGVEIKYTGLRAGEKLYEEVLNSKETSKPSFHEKIRIASVREYDYLQVKSDIDELVDISKKYDDLATVRKMKAIVPEYVSNNSIYEQLDKHDEEHS